MRIRHLLVAVILGFSSVAVATKARLQALNQAQHVDQDEQRIFTDVTAVNRIGSLIAFETGITSATATSDSNTNAEAVFAYQNTNQQTWALALGHQDQLILTSRAFINDLGHNYKLQQNPTHLFWGQKGETLYSVGVFYSHEKDQLNQDQETSAGLSLGTEIGPWRLSAAYAVENYIKKLNDEFKGQGAWSANITYVGDFNRYYFSFFRTPARTMNLGIDNEFHLYQKAVLGLVDTTERYDHLFFWDLSVVSVRVDCRVLSAVNCSNTYSSTSLPMTMGFEAQAAEWLVLRGSVTQTVLINQTKDEIGYPQASGLLDAKGSQTDLAAGSNNTQVAVGAGLKFGALSMDGVLGTGTSQKIDSSNLLSQVGLKYSF